MSNKRRADRTIQYHARCAQQYKDAATQFAAFPRIATRALNNARFHENQIKKAFND
jgi:hypothetical protein